MRSSVQSSPGAISWQMRPVSSRLKRRSVTSNFSKGSSASAVRSMKAGRISSKPVTSMLSGALPSHMIDSMMFHEASSIHCKSSITSSRLMSPDGSDTLWWISSAIYE